MIQVVVKVRNFFGFADNEVNSLILRVSSFALTIFLILFFHQASLSQVDDDAPFFEIEFSKAELILPCPKGCAPDTASDSCNDDGDMTVSVKINSTLRSSSNSKIWFEYAPETGSIVETANGLVWDLSGATSGKQWLKVKMNQGFETVEALSKSVEVSRCDCTCKGSCASIELSAEKNEVTENKTVLLRAIQTGYFSESVRLSWNITNGEILSGQGSNIVRVRANESGNGELLVNLEVNQPSGQCERVYQLRVRIIPGDEKDQ